MTTAIVLSLALGGSLAELRQDPAPVLPPIPAIPSQAWSLGGTSEIQFEWSVDPKLEDAGGYYFSCSQPCRGNKHLLHKQCDSSCDGPCTAIHQYPVLSRVRLFMKEFENMGQIGAGLNRFGIGGMEAALHYSAELKLKQDLQVVDKDAVGPLDFNWKSGHWNDKPCSTDSKLVRMFSRKIVAKWKLIRFDSAPDGRQIQVDGPSGEVVAGYLESPDHQAIPAEHRTNCRCSIAPDTENEHGMVPGNTGAGTGPGNTHVAETGVCMGNGTTCNQATDKMLADCKFEIVCENMNTCTVSATNPTNEPMVLCVNPGAVCVPNDPNVQNMGVVDRIEMRMEAGQSVSMDVPISHGPFEFPPPNVAAKGRVLCLNMKKKEPHAGIKFKVGLPAHAFIAELAAYSSTQRFRGSREQIRMWIATDFATIDDIGKVLVGGAGEGTYLMALHEIHFKSSLDATSAPFRKCWQPSLLLGGSVDGDTAAWFIANMTRFDGPGLAKWIRSNHADLAELLGSQSKDYERVHLATVSRELGASRNPDVRSAAIEFLLKGVPNAARTDLAKNGGIDGIGSWLKSGDTKAAESAFAVLEAYPSPAARYWASNLAQSMPDTLKERAKKLLGSAPNPTRFESVR